MNRCAKLSFAIRARFALTVLACAALAPLPAAAQMHRNFAATALRGSIAFTSPPDIALNGKPARLAPGARIRGLDNMLQMPGALVGMKFVVNYTFEPNGLVHEVWLLTPAESAQQPWPTTPAQAATWSFDFPSQTWTKR